MEKPRLFHIFSIIDTHNRWMTLCVQGYIAAVRTFHKRPNLKKWTCFLWSDFQERNAARVTFEKRHLRLSDGEDHPEFKGLLKQPVHWLNPSEKEPNKKTVVKASKPPTKRAKLEPTTSATTEPKEGPPVVMMWDGERNEMVPVVCIE